MEETKKKRGAWVIHIKASAAGQGIDAGCSTTPDGGMPHYSKPNNLKDKKEG